MKSEALMGSIKNKVKFNALINKEDKWNYLLMYLLIANSAIPFFYLYIEFKVITFIILIIVFLFKGRTLDKFLFIYLFFFFVLVIGQYYTHKILPIKDYSTIVLRILIAYFTIKIVLNRFFKIYVDIIYLFAIISFLFYIPSIIIPQFAHFFIKISPYFNPPFNDLLKNEFSQIILFNFNQIEIFRNSGPFWEPGTFGGFLIIGIIINTVMKGNIIEKKNIVMVIALLTTLSTTNYIAFFLFILIYFIFIEKKTNPALVIIPLLAIFVALFFEVGFLHNKIFSQINEINMYYKAGKVGNRFVSAYVDLQEFVKHPIFGQGRGEITKQSYSRFEGYRTNGIITYLADFGLMFFLFYFSNLYISFYRFCSLYGYKKYLSMAVLFLLMMIGFSEEYYNFPFFYALTMLHLAIPRDFLNYFQVNGISKVNNNYYE